MKYYVGLPALLVAVALLLWLWRWYMEQRRLLPGILRAWLDSRGLSNEEGAEELSNLLQKKFKKHPKNIDPRTFQRWVSGQKLPHPMTHFMVKQVFDDPATFNNIAEQARRDDLDILDAFAGKRTPSSPPRMVSMTMDAAKAFYKDELEDLAKRQSHRKRHRARKKRHSK